MNKNMLKLQATNDSMPALKLQTNSDEAAQAFEKNARLRKDPEAARSITGTSDLPCINNEENTECDTE